VNFVWALGFKMAAAASVHMLGGLSALAVVWIAGSRKGKFPKEVFLPLCPGITRLCFVRLFAGAGGLAAWNVAGAVIWLHAPLAALPATAVNTLLSASGSLAATFTVTRVRFGKPDASLCANGWLAGLVRRAPAPHSSRRAGAFVGLVTGIATPLLVEVLELALSIDDPSARFRFMQWRLWIAGRGHLRGTGGSTGGSTGGHRHAAGSDFALGLSALPFAEPRGSVPRDRTASASAWTARAGRGAYPDFVIHRDESYR